MTLPTEARNDPDQPSAGGGRCAYGTEVERALHLQQGLFGHPPHLGRNIALLLHQTGVDRRVGCLCETHVKLPIDRLCPPSSGNGSRVYAFPSSCWKADPGNGPQPPENRLSTTNGGCEAGSRRRGVAQRPERRSPKPDVAGSTPVTPAGQTDSTTAAGRPRPRGARCTREDGDERQRGDRHRSRHA